jgi:lipopolysaccharide export LptBFGC system permease protein LptF
MTGPGDEMAAGMAGRGRLRASHADREQVIGTLKTAFVQGRLTQDEFDARVGQVYTSRTYAELAEVTTDLPAGLARTKPPRDPWRATKLAWRAVYAIILPAIVTLIALPGGRGNPSMRVVITTAVVTYLFFWLCGVGVMVGSRHQKRSAGQLPPGSAPGAGG